MTETIINHGRPSNGAAVNQFTEITPARSGLTLRPDTLHKFALRLQHPAPLSLQLPYLLSAKATPETLSIRLEQGS
jgi:hypothetical protein